MSRGCPRLEKGGTFVGVEQGCVCSCIHQDTKGITKYNEKYFALNYDGEFYVLVHRLRRDYMPICLTALNKLVWGSIIYIIAMKTNNEINARSSFS